MCESHHHITGAHTTRLTSAWFTPNDRSFVVVVGHAFRMCLRGRYGFQETAKFGPRFAQVHTATLLITEKVSLSVSVVSRADYAVRETIRVLDSRVRYDNNSIQ